MFEAGVRAITSEGRGFDPLSKKEKAANFICLNLVINE